jgi:hypothetical protein
VKKYLINYSDLSHGLAQKNNSKSGLIICGFDVIIEYNRGNIDQEFLEKNQNIFSSPRGAGYWIWKSYIINKTLELMEDDDILFYSDSGIEFINNIDPLIKELNKSKRGLLLFELEDYHTNKKWTKRDTFFYMDCDSMKYTDSTQILASYIILMKNNFTTSFIKEWLNLSQDYRIITDSSNECGLPDYAEFIDHRHDQSILSILGRKYEIDTLPDISQYGEGRNNIGQIIDHNRSRD